jgi:hypothetical protein
MRGPARAILALGLEKTAHFEVMPTAELWCIRLSSFGTVRRLQVHTDLRGASFVIVNGVPSLATNLPGGWLLEDGSKIMTHGPVVIDHKNSNQDGYRFSSGAQTQV